MFLSKALILSAIIAFIAVVISIIVLYIEKKKNCEEMFSKNDIYYFGGIWLIVFAISLTCFILYNQYTQI